jgi:hypothetical protein
MTVLKFKGFKPIEEVDRNVRELREPWWNPIPATSLPEPKILIGIAVAIIVAFIANPLIGLVGIAAAGLYYFWLMKSNSMATQATKLERIAGMTEIAIKQAVKELGEEFRIEQEFLDECIDNGRLIVLSKGFDSPPITTHIPIFAKIVIHLALISNRGILYSNRVFDVKVGFLHPGDSEMLVWNRLSRVKRDGTSDLLIETNGGSKILIPLDDTRITDLAEEGANEIALRVSPFVKAAQRFLEAT